MMKRILLSAGFAALIYIFPSPVLAVGDVCGNDPANIDISDDHQAGDPFAVHTCALDATGMKYTFKGLGVCNGFPDYQNGLQNCFTVFNENVEVDLLASGDLTGADVSGFMPPDGTYTHYFALTGNEFQVRGRANFTQDYLSIGSGPSINEGDNCYPGANASYKTSIITSVDPDDIAGSITAFSAGLPVVCDSSTNVGTLSVEIDNVGLTSYSSTLNIAGNDWIVGVNESRDINVILLDSNANVAANADAVQDVLFVKTIGGNGVNISGNDQFDATFSKDNAMQMYYFCGDGLATTANQLPGVSVNANSECIILGFTLGENAFTPTVSISTAP